MARRLPLAFGIALMLAVGWSGGRDLGRAIASWHTLGPLPPGVEVPSFRVFRIEGGTMTEKDLEGAVHVMSFWATWCGVCRGELADLGELAQDYAGREDVRFLAINHEGGGLSRAQVEAKVARYRQHYDLRLPVVLDDGSVSKAFRVRPIPHTVVIDRDGMIRYVHVGRVGASTIRAEVDRLVAGHG